MLRAFQNESQLQRQGSAGTSTTAALINQTILPRNNTNNNNTGAAEPVQGIPIYCNNSPYTSANYTGPG